MSYHYLLQYCRKAEKIYTERERKNSGEKKKEKRKRKNKRDGLQGEVLVIRLLKKREVTVHKPYSLTTRPSFGCISRGVIL